MTSTAALHTCGQFTAAYDNTAAAPGAGACWKVFCGAGPGYPTQPGSANAIFPMAWARARPSTGSQHSRHAESAPVFVFLRGGYWQRRSKEDFAWVAAGSLAAGFHVVLGECTLAP